MAIKASTTFVNKSIFIALSVALFFLNACRDPYFKNEPKDGTRIFCYGFECLVNGVRVESDVWFPYRRLDYEREFFPIYDDIFFSEGVLHPDKDYYELLAFILQLNSNSIGEWGEWKDIRHPPFFFYIAGDGLGPFVAGKEYSSPNNVVYFYPGQFCGHHNPADIHFPGRPPFNFSGLEVKLLTSSFKFGYSQILNEGMGMPVTRYGYQTVTSVRPFPALIKTFQSLSRRQFYRNECFQVITIHLPAALRQRRRQRLCSSPTRRLSCIIIRRITA